MKGLTSFDKNSNHTLVSNNQSQNLSFCPLVQTIENADTCILYFDLPLIVNVKVLFDRFTNDTLAIKDCL